MVLIPTVNWAQRKDKLFVTLDVQDVKNEKINLNNADGHGLLTFSGIAGKDAAEYGLEMQLLQEIDLEKSQVSVSPRSIFMVIYKTSEGHWPRLTKETGRQASHVKVDWNKWVDEDEEDEAGELDTSGFNFSQFGQGGMGGMPGLEGMDLSQFQGMAGEGEEGEEDDSDNDELPDLVK